MDSSDARLDGIEAQRSTDEYHDQRKRSYFPMLNVINKGVRTLCSRGGDITTLPTRDTEYVPEFLKNLILPDLYELPDEYVPMNSEIYTAMRGGSIEFFDKMKRHETPMSCFKNEKGDSILHLAAAFGHLELVKSIISECPSLLLEPNSIDRLPIHVAARAGHSTIVKAIIASITYMLASLPEQEMERMNIYVIKDKDGDTALHLAMKDLHEKTELLMFQHRIKNDRWYRSISFSDASTRLMETSACLVNANRNASFLTNKEDISPLYLAVEAGNLSLVNAMLNRSGNKVQEKTSELASQLEGKKSLVHAALKAKNTDVLDVILSEEENLVNERDEGRTCLSVGASVGFYEGICKLLDRSTSSIFECDDDGSFPIHIAVENGHVDVVKEFLKRCPESIEQINKEGQNSLHIAAKKSLKARSFILDYVKNLDTKNHLMEEQDVDGNTPLHLATINWRPKTVYALAMFASTRTRALKIRNLDGLRPLDIAEANLQSDYVLRERLTLMVLLQVYQPRGIGWLPTSGMTLRSRKEKLDDGDNYNDRVNILLLVAALVATMTFAAGFTIPGGFNSSAPHSGMAILAKAPALQFFLVCDTVAMYSSVVAIVALIWAQLRDQELAQRAFNLALPSLLLAVYFMSWAFFCGVIATIAPNKMLTLILTTIFVFFSSTITVLLGPYVIPQVSGIPIIQNLTNQYLEILMWLVNEDDSGSDHTCVRRMESVGSSSPDQVKKSKLL